MANAKFPEFVRSTEYRRELGLKRKRAIQKMYSDIAKETEKKIQDIERAGKWSGTTVLQMKQLRDLQKSVNESLKTVTAQIEKDISSDIRKVAEVTCADVAGFMQRSGVRTVVSLAHVPETAVKNIISGNIYGQRWNFSEAIWGDYKKSTDDLAAIVSKGLAAQKPIYDIAKDLEKYVNPAVRKDYDWSRIYPGTKKKSDYNAARLAITMSTHAHQQAVILSCKEDPLIDGVEWRTSGGSNVCPLCEQRNGEVFPLDKCPMDHPMGVCVLIPHYKGMKTDKETGRTTDGDDFYERNSEVDEERLRSEFEKEKERLRAEREAKNAAAWAAQEKANQNAADLLERAQKSAEELDKAVREVQEKVKALQEAAKKATFNSNSFGYTKGTIKNDIEDAISVIRGRVQAVSYNKLPEEFRSKVNNAIINSDENVAEIIRSTLESSLVRQVSSESAYFRFFDYIDINVNAEPSELAHEVFHRVDYLNKVTKKGCLLEKCLQADYEYLKSVSNGDIIGYMEKRFPHAFVANEYGKIRLKPQYLGISDIISGLTDNDINLGFHHDKLYWTADKTRCIKEAWAQYGYTFFDNNAEVITMFEELFPSFSYNAHNIVRRIRKNGK